MAFYELENIMEKELLPGFTGRFVHTGSMTIAYWSVKAGSCLPEHAHFHEQVTNVIKGSFEMEVDGVKKTMEPGMVVVIPPDIKHTGTALTDCELIDIFQPVREDYKALIEKIDQREPPDQ